MLHSRWLCEFLARFPLTPVFVLRKLLSHPTATFDWQFPRLIVKHQRLSLSRFKRLCSGASLFVLEDMAYSQSLSLECVEFLLTHDFVGDTSASVESVRAAAAANRVLSAGRLRELAAWGVDEVNFALIYNPSTPLDVLAGLCLWGDEGVSYAVESRVLELGEAEFVDGLRRIGREDLVGFPRNWVLRVLA